MSTVALIIGALVLLLIVLDRIPGVRHLISPMVSAASSLIGLAVGSFTGWVAWGIKTFIQDHWILLVNLLSSRRSIDPSDPYR